ncbi:cyclic nucleotide-gated ion channel 1-like [Mangifera indica]|uniref:cyclic nucleotide-gated ion channel 1-like n=1 Tax=Mangifera indica TaxID=29780 RepID=UPI001CF9D71F|nr:cyclic nucleotide-gated ion channel 1-like [Mangifera indica]
MSQALELGEVIVEPLSPEDRDLGDESTSVSTISQRDPPSGFEIQWPIRDRKSPQPNDGRLARFFYNMKSIVLPENIYAEWHFLVLRWMVNILGSIYLYMLVVNDDKMCLQLNKEIGTTVIVCQMLFDFYYMAVVIIKLRIDLRSEPGKRKYLWLSFLVDLLCILPVVQVLLILHFNEQWTGMNFILVFDLFLIQYALRIIRMYPLRLGPRTVANNRGHYPGILMLEAGSFAVCYLQAAITIGALWYYFTIKRLTACWTEACMEHATGSGSFYCHDGLTNHTFLNEFCPANTLNTTIYDFGIFFDALQSGIVNVRTSHIKRTMYTFRWALQNLSAFGQGLQPSPELWENLFVLLITCFGVLFLVYLTGHFQSTADYARRGLLKMELKNQKIMQWPPFGRISENLRKQIMKHPPNNWDLINGVNVEILFNNISEGLKGDIKRELCLDLLKKVDELKNWNEETLPELCDCLRPVFYKGGTSIVREGDPIIGMIFVLQGDLWTYSSSGTATTHQRTDHHPSEKDLFKEGDFFGGELVAWAGDDVSPPKLPISTRTLEARTNVDAFVLMACYLGEMFKKHNQEHGLDNPSPAPSDQQQRQQGEPEITAEEQ